MSAPASAAAGAWYRPLPWGPAPLDAAAPPATVGVALYDATTFAAWAYARQSGVPPRYWPCSLASYPAPASPALATVRAWLTAPRAPGLLLHGPPGVGKTGLAVGALWALWEVGQAGQFVVVPDLLDALRPRQDAPRLPDPLDRLRRAPVLVLDDLGAERMTEWVQERLYVLIHARHAAPTGRTLVTTNLAPDVLAAHVGDRIAWRLLELCQVVAVTGANLRARGRQEGDDVPPPAP